MHFAPSSTHAFTQQFKVPIRILAVDDRLENLVALEAAFRDSGFELVSTLSGEEALSILSENDFAAILLDVQMPGMDGFETAKLLRQQHRSKNTPIIFLTAINRTDQYERKGYISGAVDFLFKPIDTEILLAKVNVFAELYQAKLENQWHAENAKQQALHEQEFRLLKRAVDIRDEFLSIASHELNTPMTPLSLQMQSFLKMIREGRLKEMDSERLERMLANAYGQVERLSRIIKELVDVSRISSGKLSLVQGDVNLRAVIDSVVGAFAEEIRQLGCEVRIEATANPIGFWDRTRIEQIFINLLSNALKYGLSKPIKIAIGLNGENAVLTIQDHGIGVAKTDQSRIFERFERAVSAQNYGGLGLGLFITSEIVRLHGGSIAVASEVDEGATFIVELPICARG